MRKAAMVSGSIRIPVLLVSATEKNAVIAKVPVNDEGLVLWRKPNAAQVLPKRANGRYWTDWSKECGESTTECFGFHLQVGYGREALIFGKINQMRKGGK